LSFNEAYFKNLLAIPVQRQQNEEKRFAELCTGASLASCAVYTAMFLAAQSTTLLHDT